MNPNQRIAELEAEVARLNVRLQSLARSAIGYGCGCYGDCKRCKAESWELGYPIISGEFGNVYITSLPLTCGNVSVTSS